MFLSPEQLAAARTAENAALKAAIEVDNALFSLRNEDFHNGAARIAAENRWLTSVTASDKANRQVARIYTGEKLL